MSQYHGHVVEIASSNGKESNSLNILAALERRAIKCRGETFQKEKRIPDHRWVRSKLGCRPGSEANRSGQDERRSTRRSSQLVSPPEHGSTRFEIDKLASLVSHHLVLVDCGAAVSLARTCKMLEVPTLSS